MQNKTHGEFDHYCKERTSQQTGALRATVNLWKRKGNEKFLF